MYVLVGSTYHETEQAGKEVSVDSCPGQFIVSDEQMPHTLCLGNLGFCQLINNHARPGDGDDTAGKRIENDEGENLSPTDNRRLDRPSFFPTHAH